MKIRTILAAGLLIGSGPALIAQEIPETVFDLEAWPILASGEAFREREAWAREGQLLVDPASLGRSVSWLGPEWLESTGFSRIEDAFWSMPGAAQQARFGVVTVPTLRGDAAETLLNGQRLGDNLFGLAPTPTLIAALETVSGPPVLRAGLGKRTGGQVNLVSPRAIPGIPMTRVELRLGTWVPGDASFATGEVLWDFNLPVSEGQALRLAAGYRDDATYYDKNGGRDDFRDLYLAYRWEGSGESSLNWIAYYLDSERPQTLGVNRPWQGLIDDGLYPTGGVNPTIGQGTPPGPLDPGVADPGLLTAGPGEVVPLPPDRILLSRGDKGTGQALLSQLHGRLAPAEGEWVFEQRLLVERVFREKLNQFFFAEDVEQLTVDSISSLSGSLHALGKLLQWETGLQVRLEERDNRANYWNEFAYAFDITEGRRFNAFASFPESIAPGSVRGDGGRPWYLPSSAFATPETTESRVLLGGAYGEATLELGHGWEITAGLRLDHVDAEAAEPEDLAGPARARDAASIRLLSGRFTLSRRFASHHLYATAGSWRGLAGSTVGDGLNLYSDGKLLREDLRNRSTLLEAGGAHRLADGLRLNWAAFLQTRQRQEFFGANDLRVSGVECGADWQLGGGLQLIINAQYLDARYDQAAPAEFGGGSLWNVYAEGAGPTGEGNGLGYIGGFFLNSQPVGDYRLPGIPQWQGSVALRKDWGQRWSFLLWGTWQDELRGNLAGEYEIPGQSEWHASVLYRHGNWDLQGVVRNLLDADNWIHNGDTFFDQMLVSRNLPLRLEGRFRLRF